MISKEEFEKEKAKTREIRKQISLQDLLATVGELSEGNEILKSSFWGVTVNYFEYDEEFTTEEFMKKISQDWLPLAWMLCGVLFTLDEVGKQAIKDMQCPGQ